MKVSFYLLHRLGLWARALARRGLRHAVVMGALVCGGAAAVHELLYHFVLRGLPGWVNSASTVAMAVVAGSVVAWLALLGYRHMARQKDDEAEAREQLGRELSEERNLMRALVDGTRDHIYFKDRESRFLRINEAMARSFGLKSASEAVGKTDRDLFGGEAAEERLADERRVMETGEPLLAHEEHEGIRNGRDLWVSTSKMPLRDRNGKIVGTFGISRDITATKLAEQQQRSITDGLQMILASADELMACEDEDTLLRRAVELARERLGLERAAIFLAAGTELRGSFGTDARGKTTNERTHRIPRDGVWGERLRLRTAGDKHWNVSDETLHEWRDGAMRSIGRGRVAVTPIQSSQHHVVGVFCNDNAISGRPLDPARQEVLAVYCSLLGNIVARRRAEAEQRSAATQQRVMMERTDRLNTVGMLAAGMAHEINNPLQGMLSHIRALQPYVPPDSGGVRNLEMVQKAVDTIASLVRRLLVLGANDEGAGGGADVGEVMEFTAQLLESQFRRTKVVIARQLPPAHLRVAMSRAELTQVLTNLLINARDAMPDGGTVTLSAAADGERATIRVTDAGCGIAAELLDRIFVPFFTTKGNKGTGLGLSVTESLVRSSGGGIAVESTPGKGATFVITLPRFSGATT